VLLLLAAALLPRQAAARAVDIRFEGRPLQINQPWTIGYTWSAPTKQVWPQTLSYTATETGTMYFTVAATRAAVVRTGSLQGAIYIQRTSGDESGGSDQPLVVQQPTVELWQAVGAPSAQPVRTASAPCLFDGAGATANLQTPGTNVRCTFTFNAQFAYDPEQPAELRVPQVTFTNFGAANGFVPYPLESYGPTTTPGRCALVTDTMSYAAVGGKASPYSGATPAFNPVGDSLPKPPATPSTGLEICSSSVFRYTAVFPAVACGTTLWPVRCRLRLCVPGGVRVFIWSTKEIAGEEEQPRSSSSAECKQHKSLCKT